VFDSERIYVESEDCVLVDGVSVTLPPAGPGAAAAELDYTFEVRADVRYVDEKCC
jgi:hypothetical protein